MTVNCSKVQLGAVVSRDTVSNLNRGVNTHIQSSLANHIQETPTEEILCIIIHLTFHTNRTFACHSRVGEFRHKMCY
jgi:hypothetical protein